MDCSDPTYIGGLLNLRIPPTEVGGLFRSNLFVHVEGPMNLSSPLKELDASFQRPDLNNPPTPVGGIQELDLPLFCRPDLNNPPTSVGGISEF